MDMTFLVGLMVGLFPVIALAQVIAARLHIPFALILTGTGAIIGLGITAWRTESWFPALGMMGADAKQRCEPGGAIHVCGDYPLSLDSRISGPLGREDIAGWRGVLWPRVLQGENALEGQAGFGLTTVEQGINWDMSVHILDPA